MRGGGEPVRQRRVEREREERRRGRAGQVRQHHAEAGHGHAAIKANSLEIQ